MSSFRSAACSKPRPSRRWSAVSPKAEAARPRPAPCRAPGRDSVVVRAAAAVVPGPDRERPRHLHDPRGRSPHGCARRRGAGRRRSATGGAPREPAHGVPGHARRAAAAHRRGSRREASDWSRCPSPKTRWQRRWRLRLGAVSISPRNCRCARICLRLRRTSRCFCCCSITLPADGWSSTSARAQPRRGVCGATCRSRPGPAAAASAVCGLHAVAACGSRRRERPRQPDRAPAGVLDRDARGTARSDRRCRPTARARRSRAIAATALR